MRIIEAGDPEEASYLQLALEIWQQLEKAYPDHPWQVSFQGGAMIVRHAVINAEVSAHLRREGFGFLLAKDKLTNHKEVVTSSVQAGGAMLELFGMKRGKWEGEDPIIPADWKPRQEAHFA
jgi:hypothetical protein